MADEFLGRGWKFPIQVDPSTGKIRMSEYEEDIAEAIRIILGTTKGERVMRPAFGSGVREFVFGQTDETSLRLLETSIVDAIRRWEHRVEGVEVAVVPQSREPGLVEIRIQYSIRSTNSVHNLVYPYYLQDGS
ncbi:GPW/gp25 family protein [Paenibacillus rigui]|uniref:Baseplate protein n=1 Tax=Paenibacillus rigui TaxID=554312 RepID=A0A229UNS7_9BACL|nr:GPW/gp25 family protein [Paenibacillus rigui]OXM85040.1 baseplate protein [Paenibacillus rigui]